MESGREWKSGEQEREGGLEGREQERKWKDMKRDICPPQKISGERV
jgi:hypothetical protein